METRPQAKNPQAKNPQAKKKPQVKETPQERTDTPEAAPPRRATAPEHVQTVAMSDSPAAEEGPAGSTTDRLRIYVDADVLFAGASSPSSYSASQVLLTLSEITLIEGITSELAVEECRRNLEAKLPKATEAFGRLVRQALATREPPSREELRPHMGRADWKDLPHLVSARQAGCRYLTTYNVDDYRPGHPEVQVIRPGALVRRVRERLSTL
jgi:hypothetical protein